METWDKKEISAYLQNGCSLDLAHKLTIPKAYRHNLMSLCGEAVLYCSERKGSIQTEKFIHLPQVPREWIYQTKDVIYDSSLHRLNPPKETIYYNLSQQAKMN